MACDDGAMPLPLIHDAMERSRGQDALTRVMVLLTGARVLAYADLSAARVALDEGLSILDGLGLAGPVAHSINQQVIFLAVPVDPEIAVRWYRRFVTDSTYPFDDCGLIQQLAAHGFAPIALELYEDLHVPVHGGLTLAAAGPDLEFLVRILRAAKARWPLRMTLPRICEFHRIFAKYFSVLETAEAAEWLDEILRQAKTLDTARMSVGFGYDVSFNNQADMQVFELLHVARALKPEAFVDELLRQYPAVAAVADRYPNGTESMFPARPVAPAGEGIRHPPPQSTERLLEEAHHLFLADMDGNEAPRAFWPSRGAYGLALYWAGQRMGIPGRIHLESIPDTGIALLSTIDFAAGVLGLALYQCSRMEHRPNRRYSGVAETPNRV